MNNLCRRRQGRGSGTAFLCALVFGGCAVGPDYHGPPHTTLPAEWKAPSPWIEGHPRDAEIKQNFWDVFEESVLTGLEQRSHAPTARTCAAVRACRRSLAPSRASRGRTVRGLSFDPNANRTRYSANRTVEPGSSVIGYTGNEYFLPQDLSYEVDLWGRVRRSFRAAREQAQASAAAYQNVLLSLQADVAQTYFTIRSVDLDRHVVSQTIDLRQKNLALVESLHRGGADSAVDLAEAQTELSSAQADFVGLDLQRARLENALAVLCGQNSSTFKLAETSRLYRPPPVPTGLPGDLLERRPDVAEAERSMAAASEGIGVAKAAFFPSIQLTGSAGTESVALKDIFNWESRAWSIGPNVTLPLFEGGRIRAGLQQARAAYREAAEQYRSQSFDRLPRGGRRSGWLASAQRTIRGANAQMLLDRRQTGRRTLSAPL